MNKVQILTNDCVLLRMLEQLTEQCAEELLLWDADTVPECEFQRIRALSLTTSVAVVISFDPVLLCALGEKVPSSVTMRRPLEPRALFELLRKLSCVPASDIAVCVAPTPECEPGKKSAVSVSPETLSVSYQGRSVHLTIREFELFSALYEKQGSVVTRQELLARMDGLEAPSAEPRKTIVEVYIHYLRKKLGKKSIASVRGIGYRLER